jgi:hypothetical protein
VMERWRRSSAWVRSVTMGLFFAAFLAIMGVLTTDSSITGTLIGALVAGTFYGALMGPVVGRLQRRADDALGDASPRQRREASRAAWRGAPPQDPDARALSLRLVEHRLQLAVRNRRWTTPIFAFFAVLEAWQALDDGAWGWWLAATFFAVFFVVACAEPRRLSRRLQLLRGTQG